MIWNWAHEVIWVKNYLAISIRVKAAPLFMITFPNGRYGFTGQTKPCLFPWNHESLEHVFYHCFPQLIRRKSIVRTKFSKYYDPIMDVLDESLCHDPDLWIIWCLLLVNSYWFSNRYSSKTPVKTMSTTIYRFRMAPYIDFIQSQTKFIS